MATQMAQDFRTVSLTASLAFLILASLSFAWWSESIDVWVVDTGGRSIAGAEVAIVYQSSACTKHDTLSKKTNANGTAHFEFMNTVLEEGVVGGGCVERSYTITTNYAGIANSTVGTVGARKQYTVLLPLVRYTANVVGFNNITLPSAFAVISGNKYFSDPAGVIRLYVPIGRATDVEIGFGNISRKMRVDIGSDTSETVALPVYNLRIRLFDENERRIGGTITAWNLSATATETMDAEFVRFPYSSAVLTVKADSKERNVSINATAERIDVYVDFSPPALRDMTASVTGKENVKITASVSDDGKHASGLAASPAVRYRFENATAWNELRMYPTAVTSFEATVPAAGKDFSYEIFAADNQGNENRYAANFSFGKKPEEEKKEMPVWEAPELDITHIIAIVIFVFVVFIIYGKIKESI